MKNKKNKNFIEYEDRIIQAVIRLLKNDRQDKITVAKIIKEANITRPTFYLHFQTIEEIYARIEDKIVEWYSSFFAMEYDKFAQNILEVHLDFVKKIKAHETYFKSLSQSGRFGSFISKVALKTAKTLANNSSIKEYYAGVSEEHKTWYMLEDFGIIIEILNCVAAKLRGDIDVSYEELAYWFSYKVYKDNHDFWEETGILKEKHDYEKEFFKKIGKK